MDKLKAIIQREYLTRVRSKGFIIGTLLSPLLMSSFILVPFFIGRSAGPDKYQIAALEPTRPRQPRYELRREEIKSQEELEARQWALSQRIAEKQLDGYLILPREALRQ